MARVSKLLNSVKDVTFVSIVVLEETKEGLDVDFV